MKKKQTNKQTNKKKPHVRALLKKYFGYCFYHICFDLYFLNIIVLSFKQLSNWAKQYVLTHFLINKKKGGGEDILV